MAIDIPKTQKAAVREGSGAEAITKVKEIPVPTPGPNEILVRISYSGFCGSDKSLIRDEWPYALQQPATQGIAGHEGAGRVVAVGSDVGDLWKEGDRAGIKWIASICHKCELCTNGQDELQCPDNRASGLHVPGTFQEYVVTDAHYASRLPDAIKDEEVGPIMCGGVTSYTACKRSGVRPGQWLVILGAGGGLGHLGLQYAKAMGMRVIAVDGGPEKEKLCKDLGAEVYLDHASSPDLPAEIKKLTTWGGRYRLRGGPGSYEVAPFLLRPGGTVVAVSIPKDPTVIAGAMPIMITARRINIVGSLTGTRKDVEEALDFCARGLVKPILTHGTLEDVTKFIELMAEGKLVGRAVLKIGA